MKGACQCFVFAKSKLKLFLSTRRRQSVCLSSSKVKLEHASNAIKQTRTYSSNEVEEYSGSNSDKKSPVPRHMLLCYTRGQPFPVDTWYM